jgi:glycosyltransferase involved in cell wall biosynthesis
MDQLHDARVKTRAGRDSAEEPAGSGASLGADPGYETPVSVILPAYNEEAAVALQIEDIRRVLCSHSIAHEIIVVDDGSEDQTAQEALRARARVLQHDGNRGYGAALKTGIVAAQHETIVIIDADGTYPSNSIPDLLVKLEAADMAVGARIGSHVRIPWARRPAKWLLRWLATRIAERPIPDLNSGLRAFRRSCVGQYFLLLSNKFSFTTTLTLAMLCEGYHVVYLPIDYYSRTGKSKIVPRHFMDFVVLILRVAVLFQPLKIFLPLALVCGGLGVLKVIYDIVAFYLRNPTFDWSLLYKATISSSALLLLLAALQILLIGMVADGLLRRVRQQTRDSVPSRKPSFAELRPAVLDEEYRAKASARERVVGQNCNADEDLH